MSFYIVTNIYKNLLIFIFISFLSYYESKNIDKYSIFLS